MNFNVLLFVLILCHVFGSLIAYVNVDPNWKAQGKVMHNLKNRNKLRSIIKFEPFRHLSTKGSFLRLDGLKETMDYKKNLFNSMLDRKKERFAKLGVSLDSDRILSIMLRQSGERINQLI